MLIFQLCFSIDLCSDKGLSLKFSSLYANFCSRSGSLSIHEAYVILMYSISLMAY